MESSSVSFFKLITTPTKNTITVLVPRATNNISTSNSTRSTKCHNLSFPVKTAPNCSSRNAWKIAAVNDVPGVLADPAPVDLTWQIIVGAIAGVTPFVVAGIEFSKRIIAQKKCELCGGSGLVLMKNNYMKCPGCGGFLPWQSWKRFFTG